MITGGERIWCPPRHGEIVAPPLEAYAPRWDRRGVSRRGGGGGGAGFTPLDTSPSAWWTGDDGITLDGSSLVQSWIDRTANAYDLMQATAGQRPAYIEAYAPFNGHNVVDFIAANVTVLKAGDILDPGSGDFTWILINRPDATTTRFIGGKRATGDGWLLFHDAGRNDVVFDGVTAALQDLESGWGQDDEYICRGVLRAGVNAQAYINGTSDGATAGDAGAIGNALDFAIGARSDDNTPWDGKVADFLAWHRDLTSEELTSIVGYFNDRYAQAWAGA